MMKTLLEGMALFAITYLVAVGLRETVPSYIPSIVAAGIKIVALATVVYWWERSHREA